jgi:RNA polymerase sigma-70 factor (ECF subfamily)
MGDDLRPVIERARRGDREAFGLLVRKYQRRVFATALRMTGNHDDAHDVAQDAFVRAFRGMRSFDGRAEFFTWLYRIVINVALNHLRQTRRRRSVSLEEVALPDALRKQAGDDPRRALELKRMMLEVGAALDDLSEGLRAALVLVIMEGMPYREAAEILECTEGTVAWRVHEARGKLRGRLEKYLASQVDARKDENGKDGLPGDTTEAVDARR